ncbi:tyrosine-type recombinase/integrase [Xinfangfangia sp. D13-10-4-6]|uniref:tyrosine-type recombinase/integrase n=1 Tax=Pseudogemmobacter hezensis TaxID=2737662 RepID=UPI00155334FA|nr:tyrosine-type recombinase/integrase [Pseudogemmobacter hezensis]NPD16932.1 tyrosine-type recombinase/integrase [Pseudogemmobacter hezensis]
MRRGLRLTGIKSVVKKNGQRYLYRRVGGSLIPLPNLPENHPEFIAAYVEAGKVAPKGRATEGSIAALCAVYLASYEYRRMAESTRAVWRRTLSKISEQRGTGLVKDLRPDHLRKDIRALTPGAASNRIKAWRSILKFAVEESWITSDPSTGIRASRGEVTPHRQWSEDEISRFRSHWMKGTPERLAFEVIFWTGARCVDAVALGWQKVDPGGWLSYVQAKTKGPATCPIRTLPLWAASMTQDHSHLLDVLPSDRMLWIVISTGRARSVKGLSQWMSAIASEAGLPDDCTAHGLRKARAAALAIAGATASQIGAWTGHSSLSEIAHYTKQADQKGILGAKREQQSGNRIRKFPNQPE